MNEQLAGAITERELQQNVSMACRVAGLLSFHVHDSRGMAPGWPDVVIVGPRSIIYRELKTERGRLTPEQRQVGYALTAAGADFGIWRPRQWLDGTIRRELLALRGQLDV